VSEIMTPEHPRWDEFADALSAAINAQNEPGVSDCKHTFDSTRQVLAEMGVDVNVEATIKYFELKGGFCDCEVLLNLDTNEPTDEEEIPEVEVEMEVSDDRIQDT